MPQSRRRSNRPLDSGRTEPVRAALLVIESFDAAGYRKLPAAYRVLLHLCQCVVDPFSVTMFYQGTIDAEQILFVEIHKGRSLPNGPAMRRCCGVAWMTRVVGTCRCDATSVRAALQTETLLRWGDVSPAGPGNHRGAGLSIWPGTG